MINQRKKFIVVFSPMINVELTDIFHVSDKLVIDRTFILHNMANIYLISLILLLFHSPKGS